MTVSEGQIVHEPGVLSQLLSVPQRRRAEKDSPVDVLASSFSAVQDGAQLFFLGFRTGSNRAEARKASTFSAGLKASAMAAENLKTGVLGLVSMGGLIAAAGQLVSPRGPGTCDRNMCERCCNIATSAPYVVCGCHAMRNRRTASGRTWGASMIGVGFASAAFHGSWGCAREWGRRLDFWTIAVASNLMTRALFPGVPAAVTAAGMLATPFKPFLVSFVNSTAMELKYLHAAQRNPKLRNSQRLHAACCALGLGAFTLESWKPELPLVHSVWHCLSSTAVATVNVLLAEVEEEMEREGRPGVGPKRVARHRVRREKLAVAPTAPQLALEMRPLHV